MALWPGMSENLKKLPACGKAIRTTFVANETILVMQDGLLVIVPIPPSPVNFSPALSVSKTLQTLQLQI